MALVALILTAGFAWLSALLVERPIARKRRAIEQKLFRPVHAAALNTTVSANSYPVEIVTSDLGLEQGLAFVSEPFARPVSVNGLFSATLRVRINKRDLDLAAVLYEVMPDGKYFHLSYTVQRASYAADMSDRQLLTPNEIETIRLENTLLVSRQLNKGSRLLLVVDVNRGPFAQVNYGTGKDVSDESIADAKEPLRVEWFNDSYVEVPVTQ